MRLRDEIPQALVLVVGLLTGFFFVFNFLFSDGPTQVLHPERLVSYALVLVAMALPALLGARFGPARSMHRWALLSGGFGILVALLHVVAALRGGESTLLLLAALYLLLTAAGAWGGAWVGLVWKGKSTPT